MGRKTQLTNQPTYRSWKPLKSRNLRNANSRPGNYSILKSNHLLKVMEYKNKSLNMLKAMDLEIRLGFSQVSVDLYTLINMHVIIYKGTPFERPP